MTLFQTNSRLCTVCLQNDNNPDGEHFPFCSNECHEIWADENAVRENFKRSAKDIQNRISEIIKAREEKRKKGERI